MTLIAFDDAVTASNLPDNQEYGVFYVDGLYANYAAVRARLPHANLFGITCLGETGWKATYIDVERGNLGAANQAQLIQKAVEWVVKQIALDVDPIGVYASLDLWHNGLWAALEKHGARIKRWCAAYDQDPSLTLTYEGVTYHFDAHQWAGNVAPGVDKNVADPSFFTPWKVPTKAVKKPAAKPPAKPKPVPPRAAQRKPAREPVWKLERIKDRLRKVKKAVGTRFGGFRP